MRTTFVEDVAAARPRVTAVVRRLVGDDAEDVVQEAVLRAFLALSSLRDPGRFEPWLCGIALNVAKMRLRRAATEARVLAGSRVDPPPDDRELLDAVRDAVGLLPPGQRDVVLLHYVDGLSCDEIAALTGSTPGAVRVRLHRARAQLRRELAPHAPAAPTRKEKRMVEMTLADVLVQPGGDDARLSQTVVVLREKDGERTLPIWVGLPEGAALGFRLVGDTPPRPLSADLTAELLRAAGASVERVSITELRDQTFYGTVTVGGIDVDARPSDALNLAVRTGAPILVAEEVLDAAEKGRQPEGEWGSISSIELRGFFRPPPKE